MLVFVTVYKLVFFYFSFDFVLAVHCHGIHSAEDRHDKILKQVARTRFRFELELWNSAKQRKNSFLVFSPMKWVSQTNLSADCI